MLKNNPLLGRELQKMGFIIYKIHGSLQDGFHRISINIVLQEVLYV